MINNMLVILWQRIGCLWRGRHEYRNHGHWDLCSRCPALRKAHNIRRSEYRQRHVEPIVGIFIKPLGRGDLN